MKTCICADPENCRVVPPNVICKRQAHPERYRRPTYANRVHQNCPSCTCREPADPVDRKEDRGL